MAVKAIVEIFGVGFTPESNVNFARRLQAMKTLVRILVLAAIACVIYFATLGRNDFYRLLDAVSGIIQMIADNYLKK
jgi:hypothetical protein